jgi:hypothetical protein
LHSGRKRWRRRTLNKGIGVELEAFETSVVDDLGAILVVSKHIAVRTQAIK